MIGSFRHTAEQRDVHRIGLCVLGVAVAIVVLVNSTTSSASTRRATARAAHVLGGTATARLHLVYLEGSELIEEGPVTGALTGSARATLHTGAVFKAAPPRCLTTMTLIIAKTTNPATATVSGQ